MSHSSDTNDTNVTNDTADSSNSNVHGSSPLFLETSSSSPSLAADTSNDDTSNANGNRTNTENKALPLREGTLSSARFNILSTMVGGGCLSLPLAFHQAGNGFLGPLLLVFIAVLVRYSIYFLIESSQLSISSTSSNTSTSSSSTSTSNDNDNNTDNDTNINTNNNSDNVNVKGTVSFESVACAAFGPKAKFFSMGLISTICFFTIAGYGVLLRDMLLPLSDLIFKPNDTTTTANKGPTLAHNITLLCVVFLITPLCTLQNLTPLEKVGAASMTSIFLLACCISYRSVECNFSSKYDDIRHMPWQEYISYMPPKSTSDDVDDDGDDDGDAITTWDNILNALPILLSVFMCHFNVLPVHNELSQPTPKRVNVLFKSTIWGACIFYLIFAFIGSMYGNCTESGVVEGNVLLSFDEDDLLLMIGRGCLSLTITLAFPMLVVPARDTFLRAVDDYRDMRRKSERSNGDSSDNNNNSNNEIETLSEPLLDPFEKEALLADIEHNEQESFMEMNEDEVKNSAIWRIMSSIFIFWSATAVACCVKDIDIVWDFLGGSLSLFMGFLIPSGSYLVLVHKKNKNFIPSTATVVEDEMESDEIEGTGTHWMQQFDMFSFMACALIGIFIPLSFILTGNAVYNVQNSEM